MALYVTLGADDPQAFENEKALINALVDDYKNSARTFQLHGYANKWTKQEEAMTIQTVIEVYDLDSVGGGWTNITEWAHEQMHLEMDRREEEPSEAKRKYLARATNADNRRHQ